MHVCNRKSFFVMIFFPIFSTSIARKLGWNSIKKMQSKSVFLVRLIFRSYTVFIGCTKAHKIRKRERRRKETTDRLGLLGLEHRSSLWIKILNIVTRSDKTKHLTHCSKRPFPIHAAYHQVLSLKIGDTELDLGCSFDSISLKVGRTVVSVENWSCIIFGSIRPNEGGANGSANMRIFRKWIPDYRFFWNSIYW